MFKNSLKTKKLILVAFIAVFVVQNARAEKDGFFFGGIFHIAEIVATKTNTPDTTITADTIWKMKLNFTAICIFLI